MSNPKISIIIVTYNANGTLQECLDSIYQQDYSPLETIVVDGGSTDGTVETLIANEPQLCFWKSEKDNGIYDAMNKALDQIHGEWVYFLGADDVLLPGFSQLAFQIKDASRIYYGSVLIEGKKYYGEADSYRHAKLSLCHQAIIYPVSVFSRYRFEDEYKISADHVLNMRCWKDPRYKFEFKDFIIAKFNHTGVSSTKKDVAFEKVKASLIRENYGTVIWLRFLFKKFKARLRGSGLLPTQLF